VVPTYPRHPMTLAAEALTAQAASGGRIQLGIGLSHQIVIEGMWGYSFDKPARHMKEYLAALVPMLRGEPVSYEGETLTSRGQLVIPGSSAPPVLLAALAPRMLELAGGVADGTITWCTGPATLESHIVPAITKAAERAGKPAPSIVAGLPVCVTEDRDAALERIRNALAIYPSLPSYRAMLDKEGVDGPADIALVGSEDDVLKGIDRVANAGATTFAASEMGGSAEEKERTRRVLAGAAASAR
jgi:F420-dependent oxidoreductase-like protein